MIRSLALLASAVAAAETRTVKWWIPDDMETKDYKAPVASIDGEDTALAVNKDSTTGTIASGPFTLTAAITIETDGAMDYQETMAPIIVTAGADKLGDQEATTAANESSATAASKPKAEAEASRVMQQHS
ncbi:hypothetical protein N0V84_008507 [Fusarium piperis]|uniref:Uncharacterized protein n=1 Tax=Fusarium piperis TaxID=1435070 RepID=A0A9W8W850_9HYPO|nr:hypothetical protein N0V84_008507 [Fusarium piperis]